MWPVPMKRLSAGPYLNGFKGLVSRLLEFRLFEFRVLGLRV